MEFVVIAVFIQALAVGFFCGYIAKEKGRSYGAWFVLGFFFSILAVFALIALPKVESTRHSGGSAGWQQPPPPDRPVPPVASTPPQQPQRQDQFNGQRDIAVPAYQLFLTKRFGIERNNTLDKFVIGDAVFDDLRAALTEADSKYSAQIEEIERLERVAIAQRLQAQQAAEKLLAEEKVREAKQKAQQEIQLALERERHDKAIALALRRTRDRQKALRKAVPWAIGTVVVICIAAGVLIRQQLIEAEALRLAWRNPGEIIKDCAECPEMITIPAGKFAMGSGTGSEQPIHQVTVPSFLMGRSEITQGQWRGVMGDNPSHFRECGENCPVENVSWDEAKQFAKKLSEKTGKTYRLPSEAEWEYSARGGGRGDWGFGDDESSLAAHAWFEVNSDKTTHAVGQKKASVIGLHDMHGNVWEWVEDAWHDDYKSGASSATVRAGSDWATRVLRGGSFFDRSKALRSANRHSNLPGFRSQHIGLRIARTL